jgi:peptidyl-prolyl cis-trans isomerase C
MCAALILALAGCSPNASSVAKVGNRVITLQEFEAVAARAGNVYPGPPDSAKRLLLNDLVQRALLLEVAAHRPYGDSAAVALLREPLEREALSSALVERLIPREIPVSEAEMRDLFERRRQEAHIQVIFSYEATTARAARAALDRGADFTEASVRYSSPGVLPPGGDLGFVTAGSLPAPLDALVTEAPLGQVVGPLEGPDQAWYLAKVVERRPREAETFEAARPQLQGMLQQRKRRALSIRAFKRLSDTYQVRVDEDGPRILFARFNEPTGMDTLPDTQDPTLVLARYRGADGREATYKLRDALDDLQTSAARPDPAMLPSIQQWIEARVIQRVVLIEARRRRLDQEPEVADRIREQVEQRVLEQIFQEMVVDAGGATQGDFRAAFERQAPYLVRLEAATVQYLTLPDSAAAASALERARGSRTLKEAVILASSRFQVQEREIRFPSDDPEWGPLEGGLSQMPPGSYGGPIPVAGGWRIVQLVNARQSQLTLENLPDDARQMIAQEAENLARERRLGQVTDSLRHALPVHIDLERLKRARWPASIVRVG